MKRRLWLWRMSVCGEREGTRGGQRRCAPGAKINISSCSVKCWRRESEWNRCWTRRRRKENIKINSKPWAWRGRIHRKRAQWYYSGGMAERKRKRSRTTHMKKRKASMCRLEKYIKIRPKLTIREYATGAMKRENNAHNKYISWKANPMNCEREKLQSMVVVCIWENRPASKCGVKNNRNYGMK